MIEISKGADKAEFETPEEVFIFLNLMNLTGGVDEITVVSTVIEKILMFSFRDMPIFDIEYLPTDVGNHFQ